MNNKIFEIIYLSKDWQLFRFYKNFSDLLNRNLTKKLYQISENNITNLKTFFELEKELVIIKNFLNNTFFNNSLFIKNYYSNILNNDFFTKNQHSNKNNFTLLEIILSFITKNFNEFTLPNYYQMVEVISKLKNCINDFNELYQTNFNNIEVKTKICSLMNKRGKKEIYLSAKNFLNIISKILPILLKLELFMKNIFKFYIDHIFQLNNRKYSLELKNLSEDVNEYIMNLYIHIIFEKTEKEIIIKTINFDLLNPFVYSISTKNFLIEEWINYYHKNYPLALSGNKTNLKINSI